MWPLCIDGHSLKVPCNNDFIACRSDSDEALAAMGSPAYGRHGLLYYFCKKLPNPILVGSCQGHIYKINFHP